VWTLLALPVAALVASPVLAVLVAAAVPAGDVWRHIAATTLPEMLGNSVLLVLLVGAMTASCGAVTAWLVTACRFPGSRALDVALLLPMAMPAYVCAYAYTWLLDVAGPAQTALRDLTGLRWGQYWFPRSAACPARPSCWRWCSTLMCTCSAAAPSSSRACAWWRRRAPSATPCRAAS
jgi:iron(III) transport system permease protein